MIEIILDYLVDVLFADRGDAVMAWVQTLPLIIGAGQAIYGGIQEGKQRKKMADELSRWNADNEAWYNSNFHGDFTQRADAQNIIRQMREEMNRQSSIDSNTAAVMGTTNEVQAANQEGRNKGMANLFGGLAAQGQHWKDNVQNRYLARKQGLQGMYYDTLGGRAESANNLMYNGINTLGSADFSSMASGFVGKGKGGTNPFVLNQTAGFNGLKNSINNLPLDARLR